MSDSHHEESVVALHSKAEYENAINLSQHLPAAKIISEMVLDSADCVIVTWDDVVNAFWAAVGIDYADRKSTRLNSSHVRKSRMPSSA